MLYISYCLLGLTGQSSETALILKLHSNTPILVLCSTVEGYTIIDLITGHVCFVYTLGHLKTTCEDIEQCQIACIDTSQTGVHSELREHFSNVTPLLPY